MSERFISLEEQEYNRRMAFLAAAEKQAETEKQAKRAAQDAAEAKERRERLAEEAKVDEAIGKAFAEEFVKPDPWNR